MEKRHRRHSTVDGYVTEIVNSGRITEEKVLEMCRMLWYVAVEDGKYFHHQEEEGNNQGVGDNLRQLLQRFLPRVKVGHSFNDKPQYYQQGGAGGEGRR